MGDNGFPARHGGTPMDGFFRKTPSLKWMTAGGSPAFRGKAHMAVAEFYALDL